MATNEEDRIAPIPLPAGSFELETLRKNLDSAVSVKNREQHPERIAKAIVASADETTKKVLAGGDRQAVPIGAKIIETETVYAEGEEPVKGETVVFTGVDAKSGEEAATMKYEPETVEDAAANQPEEAPPPLSELAKEAVADKATDTKDK